MFRSVFLKTLRDQRVPAFAWGLAFGLIALLNAVAWAHAYPDPQSRARLLAQIQHGLSVTSLFYGDPRNLDEVGGWMEWRGIGFTRLLVGIIAALTASGVTRGSEESGTLECVLATAKSRRRVFIEQSAAVFASLCITCLVIAALVLIAPAAAGEPGIGVARAVGSGLNLFVGGAFVVGLTLVVSQLTVSHRTAALVVGALVIAIDIWDNLGVVSPSLAPYRVISPFYLETRSSPLANGHFEPAALAGLVLLAIAGWLVSAWLLDRRDFGGVVPSPLRKVYRDPQVVDGSAKKFRQEIGLKNAFLRGVAEARVPVLAWGIGLGLLSALMTAIAPNMREALLQASGSLQAVLGANQITDSTMISFTVFGLNTLLVSFFALTLAASWVSEELSGRLELELATPISRRTYFLERLLAAMAALVGVIILAGLGMYATAVPFGVDLSYGRAAVALILLVPFVGAIIGFGLFVSSVWARSVIAVGAGALIASYLLDLLVPLFGWPPGLRSLSVFYLYGSPPISGIDWIKTTVLCAAAVFFGGTGAVMWQRRDVAR